MKQLFLTEHVLHNDLKKFRQACGLTQSVLAKLVGTTQNTISGIENSNYKSTSLFLALKISRVLGYHVEDIFYLSEISNF